MKRGLRKSISILLLFAMLITGLPLNAYADTQFTRDNINDISSVLETGAEIFYDIDDEASSDLLYEETDGLEEIEEEMEYDNIYSLTADGKSIRQVAAANHFTSHMFLLSDGTVWSWGGANLEYIFSKTSLRNIVKIRTGAIHYLALDKFGRVWEGYRQSTLEAKEIEGKVTEIAACGPKNIAINSYGDVFVWSYSDTSPIEKINIPANIVRIYEESYYSNSSAYGPYMLDFIFFMEDDCGNIWAVDSQGAYEIQGMHNVKQIDTGSNVIYFLTEYGKILYVDGKEYKEGWNFVSEFRKNNVFWMSQIQEINIPSELRGYNVHIEQISAGKGYPTGNEPLFSKQHLLVRDSSGMVWSMGCNTSGQLGNGYTSSVTQEVLRPIQSLSDIEYVSAGRVSSLAIKNDGSIWFWGHDGVLQATPQDSSFKSPTPVLINGDEDTYVTGEIVANNLGDLEFVIESYQKNSRANIPLYNDDIIDKELQNDTDIDYHDDFDAILNSMSEEAREIYLDYLINYSPYLGEYYKESIDNYLNSTDANYTQGVSILESDLNYTQSISMSAAADILINLESNLTALGLPTELVSSFVTVGASLVASIAENVLPAAKIALVLSAGFTMYQVIINWDTVVDNWDGIVASFTGNFSAYVSSSTMTKEFTPYKGKTQLDLFQTRTNDIVNNVLTNSISIEPSAKKHVSKETIIEILSGPQNTLSAYGSNVRRKEHLLLIVIKVNDGVLGKLNEKLTTLPRGNIYDTTKNPVQLRGGQIYILIDNRDPKIFHVHFSFIDETDLIRKYESLNIQYLPIYKVDPKYAKLYEAPPGVNGNGKLYGENQLRRR